MTATYLLLNMLFGTFGVGFVLYAKAAGKLVPAIAGAALIVIPFLITNVILLTIVCGVLTALPFVFRDW